MIITLACIILVIAVYLAYDYGSPPKDMKEIPTIPVIPLLIDAIKGVPFDVTYKKIVQPIVEKAGYAKVWRLGRWVLFVQDPSMVKEVYNNTEVFTKIEKINDYCLRTVVFGNSNIVFSNGEDWKRHRKIVNPAFKKKLDIEVFGKYTNLTIDQIEKNPCDIDIHSLIEKTTIDILGETVLGYKFNTLIGKSDELFNEYCIMMDGLFENPIYELFPLLDKIYRNESRSNGFVAAKKVRELLGNIIEKKRKNLIDISDSHTRKDLLSSMITSGERLSNEDLLNDTLLFFMAGHDTTANTLSSAIFYLCDNIGIQTKARREVTKVMGDKFCVPNIEQLNQMDYLMMVIKETTRCASTIPVPERNVKIDYTFKNGLKIKKGRMVGIHLYGSHHDTKKNTEAYMFNPDRYLDEGSNNDWMPFGHGTRKCVAMNFSIAEQKVILSMLLMKYEFKLSTNKIHPYKNIKLNAYAFLRYTGLYVDFIKRC